MDRFFSLDVETGDGARVDIARAAVVNAVARRKAASIDHLAGLTINLLGSLEIHSGSEPIDLPASRKTRALLGYLLIAERPQRREHLCDLLWEEGPDDSRGALRWSLSKLRPVVDRDQRRLVADREVVAVDRDGVRIDLHRAQRALDAEPPVIADLVAALIALREPLLAGLDLPRHERFTVWLGAERAAAERLRRSLLHRHLVSTAMSPEDRLPWAREWLDTDPFNPDAAAQLQST